MREKDLTYTSLYAGHYREIDKRFLAVKEAFLADCPVKEFPEYVKAAVVEKWDREHGKPEESIPLEEILHRIAALEEQIRRGVRLESDPLQPLTPENNPDDQIKALRALERLANTNLGMK